MNIRTYHICTKADWLDCINVFHPIHHSHYIDLPSGKILVAAMFASEWAEEQFHCNCTNKISLPHPVFDQTGTLTAEAVTELAYLGLGSTSTIADVVRITSAINPLFKLTSF